MTPLFFLIIKEPQQEAKDFKKGGKGRKWKEREGEGGREGRGKGRGERRNE